MTRPTSYAGSLITPASLGIGLFTVGQLTLHEPLGVALWSVVAAIVLLPLLLEGDGAQVSVPLSSARNARQECLCHKKYAAACVPLVLGVLFFVGLLPAIVLTVVAWSLVGGVQLLSAARLPATFAIAVTIVGASLSFTWPICASDLLTRHDFGPWLQRLVNISPAFALNGAIAPDDPLTHRPLAYRLMNLGQDVSYAMPTSVWPCAMLHAAVGLAGSIAAAVRRRSMSVSLMPSPND